MKWICLLLFGSVGLTAFVAGAVWGAKRYALFRSGARTSGAVVDVAESVDSRSRSYYPVVEFATSDGVKHRFRGSTGSGVAEYEKGASVAVIYDRADPSKAQIADFEQFWLGPVGVGLFGFLFLVGGIGGFILVADSDRTFGPAFEAAMARAELFDGKRGIALPTVITGVRPQVERGAAVPSYVIVCRGGAPGGAARDFLSAPLSFDPGPGVVGKGVTVYADPQDAARYYVHVDPLFSAEKNW